MERSIKTKAKKKEPTRRNDWENNQAMISNAFFKALSSSGQKMPTYEELAKQTGLSEKTIERHLASPTFKKNCTKMRAIQDKMLIKFASITQSSKDPRLWDLYFQITEPEFKVRTDITSGDKPLNTKVTLNLG